MATTTLLDAPDHTVALKAADSAGTDLNAPAGWTTDELFDWWRRRNYRDPTATTRLDFNDQVERVAMAQHLLSWNTPEDVSAMYAAPSSRATISDLWARLPANVRRLARKRAAVLIAIGPAA